MKKKLKISAELSLPLDAVTQTFGILAVRRAGKSNAAAVMAEEMFHAGLPFVVVDPKGDWWGLRSSGDGKGAGLAIPIFGGDHGDVPLEKGGGAFLADLIASDRLSCILDTSELSKKASTKFLEDFADRLLRKNREALHLFLEEADDYIPQKPFGEQTRCLAAFEKLVKRGGFRGIGVTLISQRSASLNKNVLTQIETLIALRTTSPQDRKAILAWIDYHTGAKDLVDSLPELTAGEAWVWSPQWLGLTKRIQFRRRRTFDSGSTPKATAKRRRAPTTLADVDLGKIREQMGEAIERAQAEDPKLLQVRIRELERELAKREGDGVSKEDQERLGRLEAAVDTLSKELEKRSAHDPGILKAGEALHKSLETAMGQLETLLGHLQAVQTIQIPKLQLRNAVRKILTPTPAARREMARVGIAVNGEDLPRGPRRILTAIAQHEAGATREQLSVLTGYKRSSRDTYIQRLRERGYVEQLDDVLVASPEGIAALGSDFEPLPKGRELQDHWLSTLPTGERRILEVLVDAYPKAVERDVLSEVTGYKRSSRDTYIQKLKARKLVDLDGSAPRASQELF